MNHVCMVFLLLCIYLGRFCCHFDASLKDGNRKARVRGTAQPQAEIFVGRVNLGLRKGMGERVKERRGRKGEREVRERERGEG